MEKKKSSHESKKTATLPVLPLPKIDGQATRVILSAESVGSDISCDTPTLENPAVDQNRTRTVVAGHYSFRRNYNKNYIQRWSNAEKQAVEKITGSSRYPWRPAIPFLSNATDNSYRPACIVGGWYGFIFLLLNKPFVLHLLKTLVLCDLVILYSLLPICTLMFSKQRTI